MIFNLVMKSHRFQKGSIEWEVFHFILESDSKKIQNEPMSIEDEVYGIGYTQELHRINNIKYPSGWMMCQMQSLSIFQQKNANSPFFFSF